MENAKPKTSRRNFLLAVGAGSAATVAAIAAKTAPREETTGQKAETTDAGYKLSEHIRNYYRTTLV
jgi:hypothetical protein